MEYFLFFIGGFILGFLVSFLFKRTKEVNGTIDIDPSNGLCRIRVLDNKISNPNKIYAMFKINHNIKINEDISREEQAL